MARILHCHPGLRKADYHIYTDLDFWDSRRILKDLCVVKRNFSDQPPGNTFPTQITADNINKKSIMTIEKRLGKAISSPPRHVVVEKILAHGFYEFEPGKYYPSHWPDSRIIHFTHCRLPMHQPPLETPFLEIHLTWDGKIMRLERTRRKKKHDPVIKDPKEAMRRRFAPSCF
jgi:hypothetical protein